VSMESAWRTLPKAKIRNLMSVLFNHRIRYEWLEQGRNPITLVRQSAQRKWTPEILEPHEIQNLLKQLSSCFRLMVLPSVVTPKPANGGQGKTGQRERPGLSCFILPPPVAASLFSYANSEDHI